MTNSRKPVITGDYNAKNLSKYSPKDKAWDKNRALAQTVENLYAGTHYYKYARRIAECSLLLEFTHQKSGGIKLRSADFCRVRHCPVCQWRRSLLWQARFFKALPALQSKYPKHRFIFLTLTVKNCHIKTLKTTLQTMNTAWRRLIQRGDFKPVAGFIRATEVTRGKRDTAHPHFHCLLMVPPSYFKTPHYISANRWSLLWRDCLRVDYDPIIDVRATYGSIEKAVLETLKYSVKPADLIANREWLLEYTAQVNRLRFISTGGILKDILREDDDQNLALLENDVDEENDESELSVFFDWQRAKKKYLKK